MKIIVVISICFFLLSCAKKKEPAITYNPIKITKPAETGTNDDDPIKLENYLVSEPGDSAKIQVFNSDCAVLIYPTHEQVEEMKKSEGEEDFYIMADDSNFYQAQAIQLFDSARIKTAGTQKQFIKLVGKEDSWTLDVRKKKFPAWYIILFNTNKAPQVVTAISINPDLIASYFENN